MIADVLIGNAIDGLKSIPDESIDCCITSPPYYGLRDYGTGKWIGGDPNCPHRRLNKFSDKCTTGHFQEELRGNVGDEIYKTVCPLCGAVREDKQIGLEETPEEYIERLVCVFREVKRCLRKDGTLWVNIGDSYAGSGKARNGDGSINESVFEAKQGTNYGSTVGVLKPYKDDLIKPKDLIGIPWMLAFALRADGWYLRQDIIWCLSGGAYVYVKSQKGVMPMMVRELVRLDQKTVQLWNGSEWANVLGYGETTDNSGKYELVLRSGERIGATGNHKWVLSDGKEVKTMDLKVGDVLKTCTLPDCGTHTPVFLSDDVLWFFGLYLAQGSLSDDCIQIALHSNKKDWIPRIKNVAESCGGTETHTITGNRLNVRVYSQILLAALHQYLGGHTAKDKHLNNVCWSFSNDMLKKLIVGYFDGDGSYEDNRVRLGFTRNYYLERDLRTLSARLGATITLKPCVSKVGDKEYPSFRGEWRWERSGHFNEKERAEIVEIRKSHARHFYDISVDCSNHLFSLASGVLTHNCKPNPMPESVTDRCTKSHEYMFLLSKSPKYYFDYEAIQEEATGYDGRKDTMMHGGNKYDGVNEAASNSHERWKFKNLQDKGQTTQSMHERRAEGLPDKLYPVRNKRDVWTVPVKPYHGSHFATFPPKLIEPCILAGSREGGTVLDCFAGSGTTLAVAMLRGRNAVGCELNEKYADLIVDRIEDMCGRLDTTINKRVIGEGGSISQMIDCV